MNDGGGSEWTARLTTALRSSRRVRRRLLERRRAERTTAPERVWRCRAGLMLEADCVHDHARPRPEWTWTTCGVDSAQATSVPMHADCPAARERDPALRNCARATCCDRVCRCASGLAWVQHARTCTGTLTRLETRDTVRPEVQVDLLECPMPQAQRTQVPAVHAVCSAAAPAGLQLHGSWRSRARLDG